MEMKPQLTTCGWCHERAIVKPVLEPQPLGPEAWEVDFIPRYAVFQCDECHGRMIAQWDTPTNDWESEGEVEWFPKARSTNEYPGVPETIATTAREAWGCYESDLYRSAVTTARTVIEQAAKSHGYVRGSIKGKIEKMVSDAVLPSRIADAVTALREAGNDMVHGDLDASMSAPEAETWLTVMDQMLEEIYVAPKRIHDLTQAVSEIGRTPPVASHHTAEAVPPRSPSPWLLLMARSLVRHVGDRTTTRWPLRVL